MRQMSLSREFVRKATRYALFGGFFAGLYFGLVWGAQRLLGLGPGLATCLGYAVIVPLHYVLHARVTFATDLDHRQALPRHLIWQVVSCLLGATLTSLLAGAFQASPLMVAGLSTLIVNAVSFLVALRWIFQPKPRLAGPPV